MDAGMLLEQMNLHQLPRKAKQLERSEQDDASIKSVSIFVWHY